LRPRGSGSKRLKPVRSRGWRSLLPGVRPPSFNFVLPCCLRPWTASWNEIKRKSVPGILDAEGFSRAVVGGHCLGTNIAVEQDAALHHLRVVVDVDPHRRVEFHRQAFSVRLRALDLLLRYGQPGAITMPSRVRGRQDPRTPRRPWPCKAQGRSWSPCAYAAPRVSPDQGRSRACATARRQPA
jgi:hypothetical protein